MVARKYYLSVSELLQDPVVAKYEKHRHYSYIRVTVRKAWKRGYVDRILAKHPSKEYKVWHYNVKQLIRYLVDINTPRKK